LLARSEKEIEAGIGYECDNVIKEADRLLEEFSFLKRSPGLRATTFDAQEPYLRFFLFN
jgi:hypothetical protein